METHFCVVASLRVLMLAGMSPAPTPYFWKALNPPKPCAPARRPHRVLADKQNSIKMQDKEGALDDLPGEN